MQSTHPAVRLAAAIVIGLTLGCASTPAPTPAPGTPTARSDTAIATPIPQQPGVQGIPAFGYREGVYGYDLEQTTVVTVGSDSGRVEDTLVTAGSLTYAIRGSNDTLVVVGTIDSLSVASTRDSVAPTRRLTAPVTVEIRPGTTIPTALPTDTARIPTTCDSMEDAARAIARDVHIRIPAGAQRGQRWTDSTSIAVCRGGIPMMATTLSTFEVRDIRSRGDSIIAQVMRRSTLTLEGEGLQGSRRIAVAGTGTSETLFSYDVRAGTFIESAGQSLLQLRFENDQETEQVTQRSSSRVRLRPRAP